MAKADGHATKRPDPLLFFCGGTITFTHFSITNLVLHMGDQAWRTAVVAFGGGARATVQRGAIYRNVAGSVLRVTDHSTLNLVNVKAHHNTGMAGTVALAFNGSNLHISGGVFSNNAAKERGGAVAVVRDCSVTVGSSRMFFNRATQGGGAVAALNSTVNVNDTKLFNNMGMSGGAILCVHSQLVVQWSTINGNTARSLDDTADNFTRVSDSGTGGAVAALNVSHASISDTIMRSNVAFLDGGALALSHNSMCDLSRVNFTLNWAYRIGGGIFVNTSSLDAAAVRVRANQALIGGGIGSIRALSVALRDGSSVVNNTAAQGGGVSASEMPDAIGAKGQQQQQQLNVSAQGAIINDNNATGGGGFDVYAGPIYAVNLHNTRTAPFDKKRVAWFQDKACWRGEAVSNDTGYCQKCAPYQYSLDVKPGAKCTNCDESTAYCPGGAVIVPEKHHWHGDSICPLLREQNKSCTFTFAHVARCPNPDACQHEPKDLEDMHPYYTNKTMTLPLQEDARFCPYMEQLCRDQSLGAYYGILCSQCNRPYYGSTGPATCSLCLGAQPPRRTRNCSWEDQPQHPFRDGATPPNALHISLLWALYWLVFSIYLSVSTTYALESTDRDDQRGSDGQHARMELLDVLKACTVYYQYLRLMLKIPLQWLQWPRGLSKAPDSSTSRFAEVVRVLLGAPASLDCLMASWGISWPGVDRVGFKVVVGALITPVVLTLSALLFQWIWFFGLRACWRKWVLQPCQSWCRGSRRQRTSGTAQPPSRSSPPASLQMVRSSNRSSGRSMGTPFQTVQANGCTPNDTNDPQAEAFWDFIWKRAAVTALVTIFNQWTSIISACISVIFCVNVGPADNPTAFWLPDMSLACQDRSWPVVVGALLLAVYLAVVVGLAAYMAVAVSNQRLARQRQQPKAQPPNATAADSSAASSAGDGNGSCAGDGAASSVGGGGGGSAARWSLERAAPCYPYSIRTLLGFKFMDYKVDFEKLYYPNEGAIKLWPWKERAFDTNKMLGCLHAHVILCWDLVLDLQRASVVVLTWLVMFHEYHQVLVLNMLLVGYLVLLAWVRPYRAPGIQRFQVLMLCVLVAASTGMLACARPAGAKDDNKFQTFKTHVAQLVVAINIAFMAVASILIIYTLGRALRRLAPKGRRPRRGRHNRPVVVVIPWPAEAGPQGAPRADSTS